jgi:hypothetical protein
MLTLAAHDFRAEQQPVPPRAPQRAIQPELKRPQEGAEDSSRVKTVSVLATVRYKHGKIIEPDQGRFSIDEDGRPQTINYLRTKAICRCGGTFGGYQLGQRKVLDVSGRELAAFSTVAPPGCARLAFVIHSTVSSCCRFLPFAAKLQAAPQKLSTLQLKEAAAAIAAAAVAEGGSRGGRGRARAAGNAATTRFSWRR